MWFSCMNSPWNIHALPNFQRYMSWCIVEARQKHTGPPAHQIQPPHPFYPHQPLQVQMVHCEWMPSNHQHVPTDLVDQWSLELASNNSRSLAPKPLERICPWTSSTSSGKGQCLFVRIHSCMSVSTMHSLQLLRQFGRHKAQHSARDLHAFENDCDCEGLIRLGSGFLHARLACAQPMPNHHHWARCLDPRRLPHSRAGHTKLPCPTKSRACQGHGHVPITNLQVQIHKRKHSKIARPLLHPQLLGFCLETVSCHHQAHEDAPRNNSPTHCPSSLVSKGVGPALLGADGRSPASPPTSTAETRLVEKECLQSGTPPSNLEDWPPLTGHSWHPPNTS